MCTRRTSTLKSESWATATAAENAAAARHASLTGHRYIAVPLSFHPHLAIHEVFLLPDRNQLLEPVDPFERCVKRGLSMWRGHNHRHADFTHQHAPQPVYHRHASHLVRRGDFAPNLRHRLQGHRFV